MSAEVLALGFAAFTDPTCKGSGSFDCANIVCRVCKTTDDTPGPLKLCSLFPNAPASLINVPIPPTTSSPEPATAVPGRCSSVFPPDLTAIGAVAFVDPTCRGSSAFDCTKIVCRACKTTDHPQLESLKYCSNFPNAPVPAPIPTVPAAVVPETSIPEPASPAPAVTNACSEKVPKYAAGLGLAAFTDPLCEVTEALDCVFSVCRACKTSSHPAFSTLRFCSSFSPPATPAPKPSNTAPPAPSAPADCSSILPEGSANFGFYAFPDPTCKGVTSQDCFSGICRLCKTIERDELTVLNFRDSFPNAPKPAPVDTEMPAPASTAWEPDAPTEVPRTCSSSVPPEAAALGLEAFVDASCKDSKDLDCAHDMCRYCKIKNQPELAFYQLCSSFDDSSPAAPSSSMKCDDLRITSAATAMGITVFQDSSCSPTSPDCLMGMCQLCKNDDRMGLEAYQFCNTFPDAPVVDPMAETCPYIQPPDVTSQIGIVVFTDLSCKDESSFDCFQRVCRVCKVKSTLQSRGFKWCSQLPTPPPMDVEVTSDLAPDSNYCTMYLDNSALSQGIWADFQSTGCGMGGGECNEYQCNQCRYLDTEQSLSLPPCSGMIFIALPTNPDDAVAASRPASGPSYCSDVLDSGSVSSGIWAGFDRECDARGCNNFSCRSYKLFETTASTGLVPCDQLMYIPPPPSVVQLPSEMEVPTSATEIPTPIEDEFPISATDTPTPSEGEFPSIATEAPLVFDDDFMADHLPLITVDGTVVTGPFFSLDGVVMLRTPIGPVVITGSEITTDGAEATMSVLVDTPNGPQSIQFPVPVDKLSSWASLNSTVQPPEGDLGGESTIEPISEPNQDTPPKTDEDDPQSTTTVVIQTPTGSVTVEIPVTVNDGTSATDATSTDVTDSGFPAVDDGTTDGGQSVIDWAALLGVASVTDVVPDPLASGTGEATSV